MSCFLKVFGRIRPSASGSMDTALTLIDKSQVKVEADGKNEKVYELHRIFPDSASQDEVFSSVAKKLVEECTEGINVTIFAYGQTGSGKTHTMLGPTDSWSDPHAKGLIPRSIEHLFDQLEKKAGECQKFSFKVNVEFVELYNEDIFDLLSAQSSSKIILRDTGSDIMLAGSKSESVDNSLDLMNVVKKGWQSRRTGATAMNRDSSRSHAILIVKITTEEVNGDLRTTRASTLNLVDLAGSERQSHTKATGERLKEATNINSSLTVLGRCIRMLAKPSTSQSFIPYRDSNLTHILKNSLGGNSKTAVIVNLHPDRLFVAESASTLLFAEACTMIKNKVLRNEVMTGDQENSYKRAIQELRQEIDETRAKVYNEFEKRIEDAEENQHRLASENTSLKSENAELRSKYNVGLVKFLMNNDSNQLPESIECVLKGQDAAGDLFAKINTLTLELEASEKRCQELQQERDSNAEKFFNTTCNLQTPRVKKRQSSSRNPRRETIYRSSSSLADESEDSELELNLQEKELRITHLETENQMLRSKVEKAMEDMFNEQKARESDVLAYKAKIERLNEDVQKLTSENDDLESKVKSGKNTLDKLLNIIKEKDDTISILKAKLTELETKFNEDLDKMRIYYETKQAHDSETKDKELDELRAELEALQRNIEKEDRAVAELKTSLNTLTEEVQRLEAIVREKDAEIERKALLISQLESSLERSTSYSSEIATLKSQVAEKSTLEEELENVKRMLQESRANGKEMKKAYEIEKKAKADLHHDYQRDIRNTKAKAEANVRDTLKSLEVMQKALDLQKQSSEEHQNEANRAFEEKMANLKLTFEKSRNAQVQEKEEQVRKEMRNALTQQRESFEKEIVTLQKKLELLDKQHNEDSTLISGQLMTRNHKLTYFDNLRQKTKNLEAENARLLEENTRLKSGKEGEGRRALRNRNIV